MLSLFFGARIGRLTGNLGSIGSISSFRYFIHRGYLSVLFFQFIKLRDCSDLVAFVQLDELYALCSSSLLADAIHRHPDGNPAPAGDHKIFLRRDVQYPDQFTGFISYTDRFDTFSAPVGNAIFVDWSTFAISLLTNYEHG